MITYKVYFAREPWYATVQSAQRPKAEGEWLFFYGSDGYCSMILSARWVQKIERVPTEGEYR